MAEQKQYVVLEQHPNSMDMWVGKLGNKEEVQTYVDELAERAQLSYLYAILPADGSDTIMTMDMEQWGLELDEETHSYGKITE